MSLVSRWGRIALVLAAVAALSSGWRPWIDAAGGAFVPADIAQDAAAARLFVQCVNPYSAAIRSAHADVTGLPWDGTFPYFPHPPFSLIVSWPLAYVSYPTAAAIWFAFTIALVVLLAALLADEFEASGGGAHSGGQRVSLGLALLAWPPVLYNLEKGQWSLILTVLVALGWRSIRHGDLRRGAAWIATAASVKVFPVVLGLYFLVRSRTALAVFVATGLLLTVLPLWCIGLSSFFAFLQQSQLNLPYWETFPSVTLSVHGAIARLFIGGQWAVPLVHAPILARVLDAIVLLPLLGLAILTTIRASGPRQQHLAFAAWVALLPVLNPQSLGHNAILLIIPLVLVYRQLVNDLRGWPRALWTAALVLSSIPRQTLWSIAPPPITPLEGLIVTALPMWGALALFGLACVLSREAAVPTPQTASIC
jgi:hypothetical protein